MITHLSLSLSLSLSVCLCLSLSLSLSVSLSLSLSLSLSYIYIYIYENKPDEVNFWLHASSKILGKIIADFTYEQIFISSFKTWCNTIFRSFL